MEKEMKDLRNEYEEGLIYVDEGIEEMKQEIKILEEENRRLKL